MTYLELKEFIKDQNINSVKEWRVWVKSHPEIHSRPERKYKNEFEGYIKFLNLDKVKRTEYWSFKECVDYLKPYNFTAKQFYNFLKINKEIPIPTKPEKVFKSEFISFSHFLSNDNISVKNNKFFSYEQSVDFLKNKNIKTVKEFRKLRKINKWIFIPSNPEKYYTNFTSYNIFLSNNSISNKKKQYLTYDEAKEYLKDKNISSMNEYKKYFIDNKLYFLPKNPIEFYKKEFVSNSDYLSNSNLSSIKLHKEYTIEKVKEFIHKYNIDSFKKYKILLKKYNINNLPTQPHTALKGNGFISNEDLFGKNLKQSSGEKIIEEFLIEHKLNYSKQFKFNECRNINPLPFDFYLYELHMCIEYDGRQHYKSIKLYGGEEGLKKRKHNDFLKTFYCLENNIKLIRIKYDQDILEELNKIFLKK